MIYKKLSLASIIFCIAIYGCGEKSNEQGKNVAVEHSTESSNNRSEKVNMNLSLLLDLSDRIDSVKYPNESMQYYNRDLGYIASIQGAFYAHVKDKKIRSMNDQMQVFFDPSPANPKINEIAEQLKIRLTKENTSKTLLAKIRDDYSKLPKEIYELAKASETFPGSNIWGFLNSKAKDYCVKTGSRNILVIITDGYIYHEDAKLKEGSKSSYITPELIRSSKLNNSDFEKVFKSGGFGLIAKRNDLSALNVLVLGINPSKVNKYDEDLLKLYWSTWLKEMGVNSFEIKEADLPSNLDEVIKNFILNKAA